jgi:hypothetical protein
MSEGTAPAELHLHIGAHKTATTHLQDILAANRTYLLDRGILYLPRILVRQMGLVQAVNSNYLKAEKAPALAPSLEKIIRLQKPGTKRLIVSEENILGGCIDLLDCLYPTINERLLPWSTIPNQDNITLYISIRNHVDILPSAYSQALRDGSKTLRFDVYLNKWLHDKPSWHTLINEMRSVFPLAKIVVWTFEKYIKENAEIIARICGARLPKIDMRIPEATKSLSNDAVVSIQDIDPGLDWTARTKMMREIIEADKSVDKFNPLSIAERNELHQNYLSDVETIKKMGVEFLG